MEENLIKLVQPTLVRKEVGNQKIRALDPLGKDSEMLKSIINGKFHFNGFRNKDIRSILFKETNSDQNKKNSAKVSRLLKILKTHGVVKKVFK